MLFLLLGFLAAAPPSYGQSGMARALNFCWAAFAKFAQPRIYSAEEVGLKGAQLLAYQKFMKTMPANYRSGWVRIPENPNQPFGKKIYVFFYGEDWNKSSGTFSVHINGGPRSDSHLPFQRFRENGLVEQQPWIFFDQPGTGFSSPYPFVNSQADYDRLEFYGPEGIVRAAEAIRGATIGADQKWNVYGQSFGALTTYYYIQSAPEGIAQAITHGWPFFDNPVLFMKNRLAAQITAEERFLAQYPESRAALGKIVELLRGRKFSNGPITIEGAAVLGSLNGNFLGKQSNWKDLNDLLVRRLLKDGKLNEVELKKILDENLFGFYARDYAASRAIIKQSMIPGFTPAQASREAIAQLAAEGKPLGAFSEGPLYMQLRNSQVDPFVDAQSFTSPLDIERIQENLKKYGLTVSVFASKLDTLAPPENFRFMQRQLGPRIRFTELGGNGHDGYYASTEIKDLLRSFGKNK